MKRSKIGQEMKWDLTYNIAFLGKNNPECKHEMTRRYWQSSKIKQNLLGQKSKKKNKMGISLQWDMAAKPTKVTLGGLQSTACPVQGDDRSFSLHTDGNLQVRDSKAPPQKQGNNLDIRQKNVNHKSSWTVTEHGRLGWQWGKAHGYQLCKRERNGQICSKKTDYHEDLFSHWEKEERICRKSRCSSNLLVRLINIFSLWLIGKC